MTNSGTSTLGPVSPALATAAQEETEGVAGTTTPAANSRSAAGWPVQEVHSGQRGRAAGGARPVRHEEEGERPGPPELSFCVTGPLWSTELEAVFHHKHENLVPGACLVRTVMVWGWEGCLQLENRRPVTDVRSPDMGNGAMRDTPSLCTGSRGTHTCTVLSLRSAEPGDPLLKLPQSRPSSVSCEKSAGAAQTPPLW